MRKDFGQILFLEEKEHGIFVYRKGESNFWFVEEQRKTRLSWKPSRDHFSHILLYRFSTESQLFTSLATRQLHWLWNLCHCLCCWRMFWIATKWKLLWRCWDANHHTPCLQLQELLHFSDDFKDFNNTLIFFVFADKMV